MLNANKKIPGISTGKAASRQIKKLYLSSVLGNLSLAGAWVALLAARGFSLVEIGTAETVFHIVSIIFEIPSGVLADVFGRKKMLIVSTLMRMTAAAVMIASADIADVCLSMMFQALSYNFSSGTGDALAYDTLKTAGREGGFEKYNSDQLIIYRVAGGISTLCAGAALFIGYKTAYAADIVTGVFQVILLLTLYETAPLSLAGKRSPGDILRDIEKCFSDSLLFLKNAGKALRLMLCNSLVGAADILLLFFLQAKFSQRGLSGIWLGTALLITELGGIAGSRIILKFSKLSYKALFALAALAICMGTAAEHSGTWLIMAAGGFLSSFADDALQVRTNGLLQEMFPSDKRATLTSVDSLTFSVIMIFLTVPAGVLFTIW